ncbi:hypothetical protein [Ideonella sp. BN130291]|uniref:hypothetical protein n=1 Tax=Ideonella sp. BN130291 TaxID=3112940 RepID=UPI002E26DE73|nr:hypothetical protein [Ideonella sp. BN130291]
MVFRLAEMKCGCGADLKALPAGPACTELELALACAACQLLQHDAGSIPFQTLSRLVTFLGQFSSANFPQKPGKLNGLDRLDVASDLAASADLLLASWPVHFEELLATRLAHVRATSFSARLPEVFGSLYRVLYRRLAGSDYQFLRDGFEAFLHAHWWGLLCKRNTRLRTETVAGHRKISRGEAAKKTGLAMSTLKRLVQSKAIDADVVCTAAGRQLTFIDEEDLRDLTAVADGTLTLQEASRRLALPERLVRQMIEAKLVALVSGRLTRTGVWMVSERLPTVPVAEVEAPAQPLRFVLRYWRLTDQERMGLIDAALRGELGSAIGSSDQEPALGNACVNVKALHRWIEQKRRGQSGSMFTVTQAARQLGLKDEVAYELANLGLLKCTRTQDGSRRITPEDMLRFRDEFVSLASLAKDQGTSPRSLLPKLKVAPVIGPSVDGSRQYFFRRADVRANIDCARGT